MCRDFYCLIKCHLSGEMDEMKLRQNQSDAKIRNYFFDLKAVSSAEEIGLGAAVSLGPPTPDYLGFSVDKLAASLTQSIVVRIRAPT